MTALLLKGGTILSGEPDASPYVGDVLAVDGRIAVAPADPGQLPPDTVVVDCAGRAVAPGFIDIHTHSDLTRFAYPDAESRVRQGITTEVVGNCGMSPAPVGPAGADGLRATIGPVDLLPELELRWSSFPEYLDRLDAAPSTVNTATLVGHGSLRHAVLGDATRAGERAERDAMRGHLDEALDAGAWGLTFGLMYAPGENADHEELRGLAVRAAERDGLIAAHLREYHGPALVGAMDEFLALAGEGRAQVSHLRAVGPGSEGVPARALERLHAERAAGRDVGADAYPYIAGHTTALQLLPNDVRRAGLQEVLAHIPTRRRELAAALEAGGIGPDAITIAKTGAEPTPACGRTLAELAGDTGWGELLLDLLVEHGGAVDVIVVGSDPDDTERVLADPLVVVGSDGATLSCRHTATKAHPRSFGTFPRALRTLLDRGLTLPGAIAKLTSGPADRLGLTDRGRIAPGQAADLVVLDVDRLADRATYAEPMRAPAGIDAVFVAGEPVLRDGRITDARPGRLLRSR
jgi:N-acyl-D-amino-acid deacylase